MKEQRIIIIVIMGRIMTHVASVQSLQGYQVFIEMHDFSKPEERRRTGKYVAGGTALAVTLLGLHHLLLRGASTITGVCVPAIIMALYIIWVLYSARRDRRKALRFVTATQLTEVVNVPSRSGSNVICKNPTIDDNLKKNSSNLYKSQNIRENPAFSDKDEA